MKKKTIVFVAAVLAVMLLLLPHTASAAVSTASVSGGLSGAFANLWTDVTGMLTGYPGMLVAVGLLLMGVLESKKHPMYFFFGLILAAVVFMIPTLASSISSAVFVPKNEGYPGQFAALLISGAFAATAATRAALKGLSAYKGYRQRKHVVRVIAVSH
jgi:mannose/fructose/N-acetylgalactosamine-specific phosphotransferase system component IIC